MPPATRNVAGAVKIVGVPETACFTDFADFLRQLQNYIILEIPESITNVVVSNEEPSSAQRGDVWYRFNDAGQFIGVYLFTDGSWQPVSLPIGEYEDWSGDLSITPATQSISSFTIQYAQSFRIGDFVHIQFQVAFDLVGGTTSSVTIGGLPETVDIYTVNDICRINNNGTAAVGGITAVGSTNTLIVDPLSGDWAAAATETHVIAVTMCYKALPN